MFDKSVSAKEYVERWRKGENAFDRYVKKFTACVLALMLVLGSAGCEKEEVRLEELDFTVLSQEQIPEQLRLMITERQEAPFQLAYQEGDMWYLAVGYGTQETGGYSIRVEEFYRTGTGIVLDTELLGPESTPSGAEAAKSYPYIVIMTPYREEPVRYE